MSLIIRLYDVYIKKNVWYFCVFYKLFHRDSVLQFVILWCAPVTQVLHMLGNNYYKVKMLIQFPISYFELLNVTYCFCHLWSKYVAYICRNQYCLNNFRTTLVHVALYIQFGKGLKINLPRESLHCQVDVCVTRLAQTSDSPFLQYWESMEVRSHVHR